VCNLNSLVVSIFSDTSAHIGVQTFTIMINVLQFDNII